MNWRLALRLARREAVRRPGRTALVVLLIAVPVCGMTMASVLMRADRLSPAEEFDRQWGEEVDAQAYLGADPGSDEADVELPAGSETRRVRTLNLIMGDRGDAVSWVTARDEPLEGPFRGSFRLVEGRAPGSGDEVALSRRVAGDLGAEVGDTVPARAAGGSSLAIHDTPDGNRVPQPGGFLPGDPHDVSVVGLVEDQTCLDCPVVVVHPDLPYPENHPTDVRQLVRLPGDLSEAELAALGGTTEAHLQVDPELWQPDDTPDADDDEATAGVRWSWAVGATALTVMGIVISAAFAVGARRQLTTLGQISAAGASPQMQRRTLTLQGTVAGAIGVVVGLVLAAILLVAGRSQIEGLMGKRLPGWELQPLDLAVVAGIGVAAATVAALLPARTAAQVPTLTALAGRRPLRPVPHRLTVGGVASVLVGLGFLSISVLGADSGGANDLWLALAILGAVLQLLGACAVAPALAGQMERLAGLLHGPGRLAARSLARHRTRTGAVVAAVAGCAALAIFAGGLLRAGDDDGDRYRQPDDVLLASAVTAMYGSADDNNEFGLGPGNGRPSSEAPDDGVLSEIAATLDDPEQLPLRAAVQDDAPGAWTVASFALDAPVPEAGPAPMERIAPEAGLEPVEPEPSSVEPPVVADAAMFEMLDLPDEARQQVMSEGLAWLGDGPGPEGEWPATVPVTLPDGSSQDAAVVRGQEFPLDLRFGLLISPELVESLGLTTVDEAVVFRSGSPVTPEQRYALEWLRHDVHVEQMERGAEGLLLKIDTADWNSGIATPFQIEMLLGAMALVVTLFVVATSLALAAAENRDEREVLTVVGTRPRDLARSAGAKAALLAGLGGVLAVPLGLAPLAVVALTWPGGLPFLPPWSTIGLLVVVVPAAVALAATVASAIAQRTRPIRISTATFE